MKKILLKITLFFFITSALNISYGATFKWKKVNTTKGDSSEWYYDKSSVKKDGVYRYYWILTNYLKDIEDNIFSVHGFHMVNCNTYESRWITYTGYDRLMGRGNVVDTYVIPAIALDYFDWKYFHPEQTLYGTLLKKVCREKVNN